MLRPRRRRLLLPSRRVLLATPSVLFLRFSSITISISTHQNFSQSGTTPKLWFNGLHVVTLNSLMLAAPSRAALFLGVSTVVLIRLADLLRLEEAALDALVAIAILYDAICSCGIVRHPAHRYGSWVPRCPLVGVCRTGLTAVSIVGKWPAGRGGAFFVR